MKWVQWDDWRRREAEADALRRNNGVAMPFERRIVLESGAAGSVCGDAGANSSVRNQRKVPGGRSRRRRRRTAAGGPSVRLCSAAQPQEKGVQRMFRSGEEEVGSFLSRVWTGVLLFRYLQEPALGRERGISRVVRTTFQVVWNPETFCIV